MNKLTHKPGIHENYLVKRCLQLKGVKEADTAALEQKLNEIAEVDRTAITYKVGQAMLNIAYDASTHQAPLKDIERALEEIGVVIAAGWWNRMKYKYYAFTDQNIYNNARSVPHCCNKAPPGR